MERCERCGELNPGEVHTCTPEVGNEADPAVVAAVENSEQPSTEFNPEAAVRLVIQGLSYAANVLQAIPYTPHHPCLMGLITIMSGVFTHEILPMVAAPVDDQ